MSSSSEKVKFSSEMALKPIWVGLRIVGFNPPETFPKLYYCYATFLHFLVTLCYPLSMLIYIGRMDTMDTSNLCQVSANIIASLKVVNTFINWNNLLKLRNLAKQLNNRIGGGSDEQAYFRNVIKMTKRFFVSYSIICALAAGLVDLPVIFASERRLLFPAWFFFNWKNSTATYHAVHTYQVVGIYIQIYQDVICDTYPSIMFWLLRSHLTLLGMRISKIGWDKKTSQEENYEALLQGIKDHQICLGYHKFCQMICSRIMLLQFLFTVLGLCMTAIDFLFMKNTAWKSVYLVVFFICLTIQIWQSCYLGSKLIEQSNAVTGTLYSCNWMDQNAKFKKVLIIFMQNTQKPMIIYAGGICQISLSTWLKVLKSTYSLFAVFVRRL